MFQSFDHTYLQRFITISAILIVAFIMSNIIRKILNKYFIQSSEKLKVDPTNYSFFKNAVSFIIYLGALIVIFYTIPSLKSLGTGLFASAGILAAIIGFASQQAFSNVISGIFIVISKPFRVGDVIKVGDFNNGIVEDITLRHTIIKSFENRRIIIPNSVINNQTVLNSSINDNRTCMFIEIGISYDSDINLASKIIKEEALKHPFCIDGRTHEEKLQSEEQVVVRLIDFKDSAVNLRAYVWANDPIDGFVMKCDLNKSIKERFDREGVEIPYPYRTVIYKNDLPKTKKIEN